GIAVAGAEGGTGLMRDDVGRRAGVVERGSELGVQLAPPGLVEPGVRDFTQERMAEVRFGRRVERRAHPRPRDTRAVEIGNRVEKRAAQRFGPELVATRGREAEGVA